MSGFDGGRGDGSDGEVVVNVRRVLRLFFGLVSVLQSRDGARCRFAARARKALSEDPWGRFAWRPQHIHSKYSAAVGQPPRF